MGDAIDVCGPTRRRSAARRGKGLIERERVDQLPRFKIAPIPAGRTGTACSAERRSHASAFASLSCALPMSFICRYERIYEPIYQCTLDLPCALAQSAFHLQPQPTGASSAELIPDLPT